jgi:hypothetical protein
MRVVRGLASNNTRMSLGLGHIIIRGLSQGGTTEIEARETGRA